MSLAAFTDSTTAIASFAFCLSIHFWQLDVNHVSQFSLGVIGNPDTHVVAFAFDPFV
jgi:hypothetical protein